MYFDIHSHILPDVDDGAKDMKEALTLLKLMKKDGISAVVATSHFYPEMMNYEQYLEVTKEAFERLDSKKSDKKSPRIYLGCEMLYYKGIGNSEVLNDLCLNKSKYLLLELTDFVINEELFEDLLKLKDEKEIIPIIAHVERYYKARNYKRFLQFLSENNIPVQINASSVTVWVYRRVIKNILKQDLFCVMATDTHSVEERPPMLKTAFSYIEEKYGRETCDKLIKNSRRLYDEIIGENIEK